MDILGLSTSPSSGEAYSLILTEVNGSRRLPIKIGSFEAQAIALELENIKPPRPMTHDLLKNMVYGFDAILKYTFISDLSEGTFYSKIILEKGDQLFEVDARPSDAIALAVRFGSEIYVDDRILKEAGIHTGKEQNGASLSKKDNAKEISVENKMSKLDQLEVELRTAVESENYEKAAKLRDQISKSKG